jgi:hypothetical protein
MLVWRLVLGAIEDKLGEDTIHPLCSLRIDITIKLAHGDGLRV